VRATVEAGVPYVALLAARRPDARRDRGLDPRRDDRRAPPSWICVEYRRSTRTAGAALLLALLGHVLDTARRCDFDQIVVALGGAAAEVQRQVDLSGCDVVLDESFGEGCSTSIRGALSAVRGETMVLLVGDQPGVKPEHVAALLSGREGAREVFPELAALHGDKGVWKLLTAAGRSSSPSRGVASGRGHL
jgi:hypothetical protein